MKTAFTHLIFVAGVLAAGIAIGFTSMPDAWYAALAKPPFNPPNWIFAPAWTLLYILVGLAGANTYLADRGSVAMRLWGLQMALNFLWSPLFFGLRMPVAALVVVVAMLAVILAFIVRQWPRQRGAALLFLPYAAWVAFATLLNASIVYLN